MSGDLDIADLERRMKGAVENLRHEFAGLRTGRASTAMLEPITVDVYGANMPLVQVASISVPEARMLTVQVWDNNNVSAVEKAIRASGLGLSPMVDGQLIRIPIPELNEERRIELSKVAGKYAEQAKVAIRNVRHHGMDDLKKMEKEDHLSEDEHHMWADEVQKLTDKYIEEADHNLATKEQEIKQV